MSTWYEVKKVADIDLSEDKKEIHVWFDADEWGNKYVSISVELLKQVFEKHKINL